MDWLNENSGLVVLFAAIVLVILSGVTIALVKSLRDKIAVQKLNFLGIYSVDAETRESYASLTVGNKSINEIGITELGLKNGKVNFDLTDLYKAQKGLSADARIVVEQRSAINFSLNAAELLTVLVDGKNGKKVLKNLRLYAVDLTGTLYQGKVPAVKKLLAELAAAQKKGAVHVPTVKLPQAKAEEKSDKTE